LLSENNHNGFWTGYGSMVDLPIERCLARAPVG
jgi:hypothetical protein